MMYRIVTTVILVVGCSGPAPQEPPVTPATSPGDVEDPGDTTERSTEQVVKDGDPCPTTFAEANKASGCYQEGEPPPGDCSYPEGECYCGEPPRCSGAEWPPMPPEAWVWVCTKYPPEVLPDGCPGQPPQFGATCDDEGKVCAYGDCVTSTYTCADGKWDFEPPTYAP